MAHNVLLRENNGKFENLRKKYASLDYKFGAIKLTQPSFYDGYKNSRIIHDLGREMISEELDACCQ